jgi:hypothetical protein
LAQEEKEDQRILERFHCVRQAKEQYSCKEDNETTPWLKHTCWPILQKNRPLDILTASTLPPSKRPIDDYYLGRWTNRSVESPKANEAKLQILMRAVDQMFERAYETLDHTHYRLRCWLQTYHQRHFRPVAFKQLGTKASRAGYISIWKQFICYVFRSWATPKRLRDEIYGVTFQPTDSRQMEYIWSTLLEQLIKTQSDIEQSEDKDFKSDVDDGTEYNSEADSACETDSYSGDDEFVKENSEDYGGDSGDENSNEQSHRASYSALPGENDK